MTDIVHIRREGIVPCGEAADGPDTDIEATTCTTCLRLCLTKMRQSAMDSADMPVISNAYRRLIVRIQRRIVEVTGDYGKTTWFP